MVVRIEGEPKYKLDDVRDFAELFSGSYFREGYKLHIGADDGESLGCRKGNRVFMCIGSTLTMADGDYVTHTTFEYIQGEPGELFELDGKTPLDWKRFVTKVSDDPKSYDYGTAGAN